MFEHIIGFQAAYRPDAIALVTGASQATFAQLNADIERLAGELQNAVQPGAHVTVAVTPVGLHWAILLALARLGVVTSSLPKLGERSEQELLAILKPDLVIAEGGQAVGTPQRLEVTPAWLSKVFSSQVKPTSVHRFADDDCVRIALSSGTTGTPKKMAFTRRMVDARIWTGGLSKLAHRRLHSVVGLDTETGFRGPLVAWATGMPAIYPEPGFNWSSFLLNSRVEVLILAPAQLDAILSSLPPDFPAQSQLCLVIVSGALSPPLYERATRLTSEIFVTYGSTEAGLACQLSPQLRSSGSAWTGVISPSAELEVVDEADQPVQAGITGHIRVRSQEMVEGYLDDPELTRRAFRDRWFYPGDLGMLDTLGRVTVLARDSEIMDLGGVRIAPEAIEDILLRQPGVKDAAAFSTETGIGVHKAFAAIVTGTGFKLSDTVDCLAKTIPQITIGLHVVDAIPRSARGKVSRAELAKVFNDHSER